MAVTDLTGYTWEANDSLNLENPQGFYYNISFNSNNSNFDSISFILSPMGKELSYDNTNVYVGTTGFQPIDSWQSDAYKTIIISGGTDATNAQLIAWLEANGTLTAPAPQVSYPNSFQDVSLTDNNGYITLTINGVDYNLKKGSSGYEVTITFQNGTSTGEWVSTEIYDDYERVGNYANSTQPAGTKLGSLLNADDSITVTTTTGKIAIYVVSSYLIYGGNTNETGGVTTPSGFYNIISGNSSGTFIFDVSGDGTIVFDGMNWDY